MDVRPRRRQLEGVQPQPAPRPAPQTNIIPKPIQQPAPVRQVAPAAKRRLPLYIGTTGVLLIVGIGVYTYIRSRDANPVPGNIISQMKVPVYYPEGLPEGYALDAGSMSFDEATGVTTYVIKKGSDIVSISVQPKPQNLNLKTFHKEVMSNPQEARTGEGSITTGVINGIQTASLITDKSWVIVSSKNKVPAKDITAIAKAMKPAS